MVTGRVRSIRAKPHIAICSPEVWGMSGKVRIRRESCIGRYVANPAAAEARTVINIFLNFKGER